MDEITLKVSIPLDDERFLRKECPHCKQEFKIHTSSNELQNLAEKGIESFLTNDDENTESDDDETTKYFCPYCGQDAPSSDWWTQEQLAYINVYAKNIMAKMVNEHLIKPLSRSSSSAFSFKGSEMKYEEPWISDETNDMSVFDLGCCNEKVKILDGWTKSVFCFYCGFKHNL